MVRPTTTTSAINADYHSPIQFTVPTEPLFKKGDSVSARKLKSTNGRINARHPVHVDSEWHGVLENDLVVGGRITLNGLRDWLISSEIQHIDGNKVHTVNSVYEITRR